MEDTVLLLPGWQNSGPDHWQSRWERVHGYRRVEQHDWMRPLRGDWVARLQDVILAQQPGDSGEADIVLVGHSLGCLLVAAWAAASPSVKRVKAALLVAPGDPEQPELVSAMSSWSPVVLDRLPFPSVLLSCQDDPYCDFARAHAFAVAWGSAFVDYGSSGHINADSGLGLWPDGHDRLQRLRGNIT